MDGRSPLAQFMQRLGPGLKVVLGAMAIVGILQAILVNWLGVQALWDALVCVPDRVLEGEVWRLVTAAFLTDISHPAGLLFSLVTLYFLSIDLERRWGTRRFLAFLGASTVAGFVLAIAVDRLTPASFQILHPRYLYGADAAITATAIAWGLSNASQRILFFMVVPMSGKTLVWVTVGGCVLYFLYLGDVMSFGGLATGFLLTGEPSPLRSLYLRARLAMLRRGAAGSVPTARDIALGKQRRPPRGDRPPLRVVKGGQAGQADLDDLGKREPPKDKRYLN